MEGQRFVNFYEVLDLAPEAAADEIEHRFRELARRFHPDNAATGDRDRFDAVVTAHATLKDPRRRAQYHEANPHDLPPLPPAPEATGSEAADAAPDYDDAGIDKDVSIQNHVLLLLYQKRRQTIHDPGIGNAELERLTGCPHERLEFHLWYLREKGWIGVEGDGRLSITIEGVDRAAAIFREGAHKRITDQS